MYSCSTERIVVRINNRLRIIEKKVISRETNKDAILCTFADFGTEVKTITLCMCEVCTELRRKVESK